MKLVPFMVDTLVFNLLVVLEPENLDRMEKNDPAQIGMRQLGHPWTSFTLGTVIIVNPSADDLQRFDKLMVQGSVREAMELLTRGFEDRPDLGDSDAPYSRQHQQRPKPS